MNRVDILRDSIIDKLLTISNKDYLTALYQLINRSNTDNDVVQLTEEQMELLRLSEQDIENGRIISQSELDKSDLKWLKEL